MHKHIKQKQQKATAVAAHEYWYSKEIVFIPNASFSLMP
jgi:hypothetical protein